MLDTLTELEARVAALAGANTELKQQPSDQGWLADAIDATNHTVIVTDPHRPDNAIIYANSSTPTRAANS